MCKKLRNGSVVRTDWVCELRHVRSNVHDGFSRASAGNSSDSLHTLFDEFENFRSAGVSCHWIEAESASAWNGAVGAVSPTDRSLADCTVPARSVAKASLLFFVVSTCEHF